MLLHEASPRRHRCRRVPLDDLRSEIDLATPNLENRYATRATVVRFVYVQTQCSGSADCLYLSRENFNMRYMKFDSRLAHWQLHM